MSRNFSRDVQILLRIIRHMDRVTYAVNKFKCKKLSDYIKNQDCIDITSLAIMNIAELSKQLTDDTRNSIGFLNNRNLTAVRNVLAHDYDNMQYAVVFSFILQVSSSNSYLEVKNRINYCNLNKR